MPKKKTAPTDNVVLRIPYTLQQEVIDMLTSGRSEYRDFSDFINGALRKEIDYQKKKIAGLVIERNMEFKQPPEQP